MLHIKNASHLITKFLICCFCFALFSNCFNRADFIIGEEDNPTNATIFVPTFLSKTYQGYPSCSFGGVGRCSSPPCLNICLLWSNTSWRYDDSGTFAAIADGNSAQGPTDFKFYPRYLELSPDANTAFGSGTVLFQAATHDGTNEATSTGATILNNLSGTGFGEVAFSYSLAGFTAQKYEYMRIGMAYYEARVNMRHDGGTSNIDMSGVIGAFSGTRVQATTITLNGTSVDINANVDQGFWVYKGDSLAKIDGTATNVTTPNPIASTSAVPSNSDVITGFFEGDFDTSKATSNDINVMAVFSANDSFEWVDSNSDAWWGGSGGETVADLGLRSLRLIVQE